MKVTGTVVEGSEYITHTINEQTDEITSRVSLLIDVNGKQLEVVADGYFFNYFLTLVKYKPKTQEGFTIYVVGSNRNGYIKASRIASSDHNKTFFLKK